MSYEYIYKTLRTRSECSDAFTAFLISVRDFYDSRIKKMSIFTQIRRTRVHYCQTWNILDVLFYSSRLVFG